MSKLLGDRRGTFRWLESDLKCGMLPRCARRRRNQLRRRSCRNNGARQTVRRRSLGRILVNTELPPRARTHHPSHLTDFPQSNSCATSIRIPHTIQNGMLTVPAPAQWQCSKLQAPEYAKMSTGKTADRPRLRPPPTTRKHLLYSTSVAMAVLPFSRSATCYAHAVKIRPFPRFMSWKRALAAIVRSSSRLWLPWQTSTRRLQGRSLTLFKSISKTSRKYSTDLADSETQESPRNTAGVSRCLTRT